MMTPRVGVIQVSRYYSDVFTSWRARAAFAKGLDMIDFFVIPFVDFARFESSVASSVPSDTLGDFSGLFIPNLVFVGIVADIPRRTRHLDSSTCQLHPATQQS